MRPRIRRFSLDNVISYRPHRGTLSAIDEQFMGRVVRKIALATGIALGCAVGCAELAAQDMLDKPAEEVSLWAADTANLDGCQVIARIDNQIILACEVLWRVNQMLEAHQARVPEGQRVPPEQLRGVREQLMRRELGAMLDRKLLYDEFRRNVPAENLPRIEANLREPFEQQEMPLLMKALKVDTQQELEQELTRLGSSMADAQRSFNERVIASEWIRSKVKINEEVSPDEMLEYYQSHLAEYDYPTQARWEELMVRKSRFKDSAEAFAAVAQLGNEVWTRGTARAVQGPAFAEVAKAKSDGFTAKEGGVHEWTTQGALKSQVIDRALFSLEVGQMSPILETDEGFHIVRVLERKQAGRKPFTEVQGDIRDRLKEERFQVGVQEYLNKLRADARIWTAYTGNVSADVLLGRVPDDTQRR